MNTQSKRATPSSRGTLRVLIVEDFEPDALLMVRELERAGYRVEWRRADTEESLRTELAAVPWDLLLSDYSLPGFSGLAALRVVQGLELDVPFILVSGTAGEDVAVEAMKAGAHDYLVKGHLGRLVPAVERELREARTRRERRAAEDALRESEAEYRSLFENLTDGVLVQRAGGRIIDANPAALHMFGLSREELLRRDSFSPEWDVIREDGSVLPGAEHPSMLALKTGKPVQGVVAGVRNARTGGRVWMEISAIPHYQSGQPAPFQVSVTLHDITERKQAEEQVLRSARDLEFLSRTAMDFVRFPVEGDLYEFIGQRLAELVGSNVVVAISSYDDAAATFRPRVVLGLGALSSAATKLLGAAPTRLSGDFPASLKRTLLTGGLTRVEGGVEVLAGAALPAPVARAASQLLQVQDCWVIGTVREGRVYGAVCLVARKGSAPFNVSLIEAFVRQAAIALERRHIEDRLKETQVQLLHAQKMEAIGQLAGGVAHDFNNLLTAILGYATMAARELPTESPLRQYLDQVREAGERAANLTRQLLLFSRRETMERRHVNLNRTVEGLLKMLKRLIGEDIRVVTELEPALWTVKADEGKLEQVLMNLAVNARDAMPRGGTLVIGTANIVLDDSDVAGRSHARAGDFVQLRVKDTGAGIPADVLPHIFEPFFTTKATGKGTGLGLSVVYGVAEQHGGWVEVESPPEGGAVFTVWLPAARESTAAVPPAEPATRSDAGHGERVLVVEDDAAVRELTVEVLRESGYTVLDAVESVAGAAERLTAHAGAVQLVLSDMVLPDGTGLEVVEHVQRAAPRAALLLATGYTDEKSHWPAIQERGIPVVRKPYDIATLLGAVRRALERQGPGADGPAAGSGG